MPNEPKGGVLQGTRGLMVLQALATLGPLHGYAVRSRIGAIRRKLGTLSPGLLRLEQPGFVSPRRNRTGTNRRARYDTITAAGRRKLRAEKAECVPMTAITEAVFEGDAG